MDFVSIITQKRDGRPLTKDQILWVIDEYTKGSIPDYQMSAFLMAVYFRGMTTDEVTVLTNAMINSGRSVDLSSLDCPLVDKHSTGGVGDKISLILAPLVAGAGVSVPMMSGRGLGHTGGTLDKLEAIPGLHTNLTIEEFKEEIKKIGFAMAGQTDQLVPADKKMYALRDVTGTVPSIPLICASIISKKRAEGTKGLVLDVKVGSGAFLQSEEKTRELARALVSLGNRTGMYTVALLTDMDEPLGFTVGNWLETKESILALKGQGPDDVMDITTALGGLMLVLGKKAESIELGKEQIMKVLESGRGLELFREMVILQGGNVSFVDDPDSFELPKYSRTVKAGKSGWLVRADALKIGIAAGRLGAGRRKKTDKIDHGAGIVLHKKRGDEVKKGDDLATLYTSDKNLFDEAEYVLKDAWEVGDEVYEKKSKIIDIIDEKGKISL